MPFKSNAQRKFLFAEHPEIAKEFAEATPKNAVLPEHVHKVADGGAIQDEPGLQDVSATDFLVPFLLGPSSETLGEMGSSIGEKLANEAGAVFPKASEQMAPKMEEDVLGATTNDIPEESKDVEVYSKGIQKDAQGNPVMHILGVKGKPEILKAMFGEEAPGSVPASVLQAKGVPIPLKYQMPPTTMANGGLIDDLKSFFTGKNSAAKSDANDAIAADAIDPIVTKSDDPSVQISTPTANHYAKGGKVESTKVSEAHPKIMETELHKFKEGTLHSGSPKGPDVKDRAQAVAIALNEARKAGKMNEGGYPHVTFMENQSPEETKKTVHLAGSPKMAEGGKVPNVGEDLHVAKASHISAPILTGVELHLNPRDVHESGDVGTIHDVTFPMILTSKDEGGFRFKQSGLPEVRKRDAEKAAEVNEIEPKKYANGGMVEGYAKGGKTPHFLEGLKKGALHKEMGIPEDKNIPVKKLEKAANSDNETLRKRAQFAINAKKFHHADGGLISDEEKRHKIYGAMGIKKYADGGDVDVSQLPSGSNTPSPTDPDFWDQIKAALSQVSAPVTGAANAAAAPIQAATTAAMPLVPPAEEAINKLTGANLPVPASTTPPVAPTMPVDQAFMDKLNAGTALTPPAAPVASKPILPLSGSTATAGMPNVANIFNQNASALTQGLDASDRQALASNIQKAQTSPASMLAEAISGLGDALATKGGREQHSLQNIFSMQKDQRDQALSNFDKARQDRIDQLAIQTQLGNNALAQMAAADTYGVDNHLNQIIGAPKGTMKKDLPTYFSLMSAQVAAQEKNSDLYMKAHAQAAADVDNAVKNSSVLGIKPSSAQIQARGEQLADQYYNRAKGNLLVKPSDGGQSVWIPAANLGKAKQIDPNLQIVQ